MNPSPEPERTPEELGKPEPSPASEGEASAGNLSPSGKPEEVTPERELEADLSPEVTNAWSQLVLPRATALLAADQLMVFHRRYCLGEARRAGGSLRLPRPGLEQTVMQTLKEAFRNYVRKVSRQLEHRTGSDDWLRIRDGGSVYIPPVAGADPLLAQSWFGPGCAVLDSPSRDRRTFYFAARLANRHGIPLTCFDDCLYPHGELLSGNNSPEAPDRTVHESLVRVSLSVSQADAGLFEYLRAPWNFTAAPVFSPDAFQFEFQRLRLEHLQSPELHPSRPYLSRVIRFAVASASGTSDTVLGDALQIYGFRRDPRDSRAFEVDSSVGEYRIWLIHDDDKLERGVKSYQARFFAEAR